MASKDIAIGPDLFFRDAQYAFRQLRRSPAFAVTVSLTLHSALERMPPSLVSWTRSCCAHCPTTMPAVLLSYGRRLLHIAERVHGSTLTANFKNGNVVAAASRSWLP